MQSMVRRKTMTYEKDLELRRKTTQHLSYLNRVKKSQLLIHKVLQVKTWLGLFVWRVAYGQVRFRTLYCTLQYLTCTGWAQTTKGLYTLPNSREYNYKTYIAESPADFSGGKQIQECHFPFKRKSLIHSMQQVLLQSSIIVFSFPIINKDKHVVSVFKHIL